MPMRPISGASGGYRDLHAYKLAEVIHDATVVFCNRFIDPKSRTRDQMVQAARSGKQNISEGSSDSGASKKSELKLIGYAKGSLVELEEDYRDYLRQHGLPIWDKGDPRCLKIRNIAFQQPTPSLPSHQSHSSNPSSPSNPSNPSNPSSKRYRKDIAYPLYEKFFQKTNPEIAGNTAICLINQATYLLNRLLLRLEESFLAEGGFTERLYTSRTKARTGTK